MTALYEIAARYREIAESDDADAFAELAGVQLAEKCQAVALVMLEYERAADAAERESERLYQLSEQRRKRVARLERYLMDAMTACDVRRIDGALVRLSLQTNPPKVEVRDPRIVPSEFTRSKTTVEVDKKAVLAAYQESGKCVPGTEVVRTERLVLK